MSLDAIRQLTAPERSRTADFRLGAGLAFVAGATNAGAFLAVGQYTSHMTGVLSSMADAIALRHWQIATVSFLALLAFMAGAATTAIIVNAGRRRGLSSAFALPLLLEAVLLLVFGAFGASLTAAHAFLLPATVILLCYTMGLQNAVITKISHSVIRTTHVTGMVTDLGIELGKLMYLNSRKTERGAPVRADRQRLRVLSLLLLAFLVGGLLGALSFQRFGYIATVPLAAMLGVLALVPALDDIREVIPTTLIKRIALVALSLAFIAAGANHFVSPDFYLQMMPPYLPAHRELVIVSGVFEILGGFGVLVPRLRSKAGWGLVLLLLAVFPANLHMALNAQLFPSFSSTALYARLPFQVLFIAWAYWATRPDAMPKAA